MIPNNRVDYEVTKQVLIFQLYKHIEDYKELLEKTEFVIDELRKLELKDDPD